MVIEIENLIKKFSIGGGLFTALNDISLIIKKGEFSGPGRSSKISGSSKVTEVLLFQVWEQKKNS